MDWRAEKSIIITIHNDIDENEKRRGVYWTSENVKMAI